MARTLGATVGPDPDGLYEFGYYPVEPLDGAADDLALDAPLTVAHRHGEAFTLPAGARHLVRRDVFENQAFRYGATTWGLQFHPEVDDAVLSRWLDRDPPARGPGAQGRADGGGAARQPRPISPGGARVAGALPRALARERGALAR